MNSHRLKRRNFSFMWSGLIHLEDGSQWRMLDPARRCDVIWWQSGEAVELDRRSGSLVLRNVARGEAVPIVAASEMMLELAA